MFSLFRKNKRYSFEVKITTVDTRIMVVEAKNKKEAKEMLTYSLTGDGEHKIIGKPIKIIEDDFKYQEVTNIEII